MSVIVKCNPPRLTPTGEFDADLPAYDGCMPRAGEEAFVWTSETKGGQGLAMRGTVRRVDLDAKGRRAILRIAVTEPTPDRPLGKAALEPHRNGGAAAVMSRLAGKLYLHSHNKVADLGQDEADFLRQHFTIARPRP